MREHVAAQIGDDTFAERHHQEVTHGAGEREQRGNADHHQKVAVDQRQPAVTEAEIDHTAHRDRHDERGQRRQNQGAKRGNRPPAVPFNVGQQRSQRTQLDLGLFGRGFRRRHGVQRRGHRWRRERFPLLCRILSGIEVHVPQHLFAARRPADNAPVRLLRQRAAKAQLWLVSPRCAGYRTGKFPKEPQAPKRRRSGRKLRL